MEYNVNEKTIKSYATADRARKTAEAVIAKCGEQRYMVVGTESGRWVPVFIGTSAVEAGIHFHHPVVA